MYHCPCGNASSRLDTQIIRRERRKMQRKARNTLTLNLHNVHTCSFMQLSIHVAAPQCIKSCRSWSRTLVHVQTSEWGKCLTSISVTLTVAWVL